MLDSLINVAFKDNAVGKGDGEFYGKQLFKCEMNYAHFTPIVNVLSKDQFCQVYDKPDDVPAQSGPGKYFISSI